MSTVLPVSAAHAVEGFNKGIDRSGPYIRVRYKLASYADVDNFCNVVMGYGKATGPTGSVTVTRSTPYQHPQSPNLFAVSAEMVEGLGKPVLNSSGLPNYDGGAIVAVEFRAPPFDFSGTGQYNSFDATTAGTAWCTQELDYRMDVYTLADPKYLYSAGPKSGQFTDVHVKYYVPVTVMTLTYHQLPYLPMTTVRNLRGRVNSTTFLGAPAECVLFQGARSLREYNTDGTVCQKLTLTFEERNSTQTWNSLPSASDPTFYAVAGAGNKMYPTADLSPLLQF